MDEVTTTSVDQTIETTGTGAAPDSLAAPAGAEAAAQGVGTAGAPSSSSPATPASAEGLAATPPAQYQPNFKYKVQDTEAEFDEALRPLIKQKEIEEKIRELYTKAGGLDAIKPKHEKLKQDFEQTMQKYTEISTNYSNLDKSLRLLSKYVEKGDFDSFFSSLKIPDKAIFGWVNQKLKEMELSPEERTRLAQQRQEMTRALTVEEQNAELQQELQQIRTETFRTQMSVALARPDVQNVMQAWDSRVGRPGAFLAEVQKVGYYHHLQTGQDLPPEQAVAEVVGTLGKVIGTGAPQAATGMTTTPPAGATAAGAPKPVLPNVASSGSSPVRRAPKSLDDLRKIADSL